MKKLFFICLFCCICAILFSQTDRKVSEFSYSNYAARVHTPRRVPYVPFNESITFSKHIIDKQTVYHIECLSSEPYLNFEDIDVVFWKEAVTLSNRIKYFYKGVVTFRDGSETNCIVITYQKLEYFISGKLDTEKSVYLLKNRVLLMYRESGYVPQDIFMEFTPLPTKDIPFMVEDER